MITSISRSRIVVAVSVIGTVNYNGIDVVAAVYQVDALRGAFSEIAGNLSRDGSCNSSREESREDCELAEHHLGD